MKHYDRVCAYIDLDAIKFNMESMHKNINENTKMIGVIKTDAYGHGAVQIGRVLEKLDYVFGMAVATPEEAIILRKCNIHKPILILGYVFPYAYKQMIEEEVRLTVFKKDMIDEINETAKALNKKAKVHVKVDTAMSRIGIKPNSDGLDFIKYCQTKDNIEIEGIFTHFAKADELDKSNVLNQLERYNQFLSLIDSEGIDIAYKHCSNSAGIIELPDANKDIVRAGITLYGLWPSEEVSKDIVALKPVLSLKSHIVYIKDICKDTEVSYGGTFKADKNMKIATIPVGYGDGYPRLLSNKGHVLIHGQVAPILGRVCMDQFMVDITNIQDVKEYDEVTLIGTDGNKSITMEDLGELCGRFNYELACDLGKRIPRVFMENNEIVDTKDYFDDFQ